MPPSGLDYHITRYALDQGAIEIQHVEFSEIRATLDYLRFEVVKYERVAGDNAESKVHLSKKRTPDVVDEHPSAKAVAQVTMSSRLAPPLVLSLSKDERFCSWFDKLTTSGNAQAFRTQDDGARCGWPP
jgi:hypothetical protein